MFHSVRLKEVLRMFGEKVQDVREVASLIDLFETRFNKNVKKNEFQKFYFIINDFVSLLLLFILFIIFSF